MQQLGGTLKTHDPQPVITLLRDHLAAHDKRLVFLFGAGTSSSVNIAPTAEGKERRKYEPLIPAVELLTEKCRETVASISAAHGDAWTKLVAECESLRKPPNIESILSRLQLKIEACGPGETALGLAMSQLEALESAIRNTIGRVASPQEDSIPALLPHDEFAKWVARAHRRHPIEIFTTNYDVLIERSLERHKVPIFDGFVGSYRPYFSPDTIEVEAAIPDRTWTRVWKLHGSVNWNLTDGRLTRLSTTGSSEMVLPSNRKYDESRKMPYVALLDRLGKAVSVDGSLIVTCGFSWGDQHVNSTVLTALDNSSGGAAVVLCYAELDDLPDLVDIASKRDNILVIAPSEGILQRDRRPWALPQPISGATASFVDISFDSDALPEGDGAQITGKMRLGDFNVFGAFLASMSPGLQS